MQKIIPAAITMLIVLAACHHKTVPLVTDRTDHPPAPTTTVVTPSGDASVVAGDLIYHSKCIKCHAAKPVNNWTATEWVPILQDMASRAALDSTQKTQVMAYVNAYAKK